MIDSMLYFGSFNPIHRGHIAVAEYVIEQGLCDLLQLILSPQSPMKQGGVLADEEHRLAMARLAVGNSRFADRIAVDDVEFHLPKPSYTINTLEQMMLLFPDRRFSILMGGDNLDGFDRWKDYKRILELCPIFVYPRDGYRATKLLDRVTMLDDAPRWDYSSTRIREAAKQGQQLEAMLDVDVVNYIKNNELWMPKPE